MRRDYLISPVFASRSRQVDIVPLSAQATVEGAIVYERPLQS